VWGDPVHAEKARVDFTGSTARVLVCSCVLCREALQTKIEEYSSTNFSDSVMSATYVKDGKLVVCISGAEFDARNMWSGRWRSLWECAIEGDEVQLKGTFKVDVHFYEDGNVQSKSVHEVSDTIGGGGSDDDTASAISEHVKEAETKYQSLLDGAYVNLLKDHSIMNGLRRPLPIDKQKVNFKTLVSQGRLAGSLR
jgi:capping protein alpha